MARNKMNIKFYPSISNAFNYTRISQMQTDMNL